MGRSLAALSFSVSFYRSECNAFPSVAMLARIEPPAPSIHNYIYASPTNRILNKCKSIDAGDSINDANTPDVLTTTDKVSLFWIQLWIAAATNVAGREVQVHRSSWRIALSKLSLLGKKRCLRHALQLLFIESRCGPSWRYDIPTATTLPFWRRTPCSL